MFGFLRNPKFCSSCGEVEVKEDGTLCFECLENTVDKTLQEGLK